MHVEKVACLRAGIGDGRTGRMSEMQMRRFHKARCEEGREREFQNFNIRV